jgi:hypothetical protein
VPGLHPDFASGDDRRGIQSRVVQRSNRSPHRPFGRGPIRAVPVVVPRRAHPDDARHAGPPGAVGLVGADIHPGPNGPRGVVHVRPVPLHIRGITSVDTGRIGLEMVITEPGTDQAGIQPQIARCPADVRDAVEVDQVPEHEVVAERGGGRREVRPSE